MRGQDIVVLLMSVLMLGAFGIVVWRGKQNR